MATSKEYIVFVCEQLDGIENVTYKKMFGEYMVYWNDRPVLLFCDNTVYVKELPELAELLKDAPDAYPYEGAKVHTLLDIENHALTRQVLEIIERITPLPKRRKKTNASQAANEAEG